MRSDNQQQNRFYELLEPELSRLRAFCRKLVGDPEQGDDLAQDALYDAWKGFGKLRETAAFKSWLYRIVLNRYRTNLRQSKKRAARTGSLMNDVADNRQPRLQAARDRLNIAMAGLSAKDQTLVTLHELEGWSHADLATMFKSSSGAVRTRLTRCRHRMRKTLRRHLEKTDEGLSRTGVLEECVVVKQDRN